MKTSANSNCRSSIHPKAVENLSPKILASGTSTPPVSYSQKEVLNLLNIEDRRTRLVFMNSAIDKRYLTLPVQKDGTTTAESQGDLLKKHRTQALDVGTKALHSCLDKIDADFSDIKSLCCVTSTGLLTPGLSALLCRELGLVNECNRLDIVGMGCNAGLNGLNATTRWAEANPGKLAIVLCIEMCSAAYVVDGSIKTSVVNSLFGDGASAIAVISNSDVATEFHPEIVDFSSLIITEAIDAMRYDWDDEHGKFSFFLDRNIPYLIGANIENAVSRLLEKVGLSKSEISHWIVHSGGKKVIDSIRMNLGVSANDVRHTIGVLRDYGNVSSGSFIFSYERLIDEGTVKPGDFCVLITMGPGATIETALIKF